MPEQIIQELQETHPTAFSVGMPSVSFLMPTYGRVALQPHVINEAVYWFTRQTYPNCELLIFNDAPGQELVTDVPNVRVVNFPYKIPSLGAKMNLLVTFAAAGICIPYEDDDISLPWRAEQCVQALRDYDYWSPMYWYYAPEGMLPVPDGRGVGHNCSAFRRWALYNRYPDVSKGHDQIVDSWARQHVRVNPLKFTQVREINYFYRWGVSLMHLSAQGDMEAAYKNADPGPPGVYKVEAKMIRDYEKIHWDTVAKYESVMGQTSTTPPG